MESQEAIPTIISIKMAMRIGNAITLILLMISTTTKIAQGQSATAPSPPGPTNITAILEKAGQFGTLIRLLKSTQIATQINSQLNSSSSSSGLTIFAPTDNAFSTLPSGTLNSLTDQQKVELIQFHILPNVVPMSQFQTVSNPVRTQAGDASNGQFPLNVTTNGTNVNIATGLVNTTVSNTLYSDDQLIVYPIDKVLLPLQIFRPSAAPAPAPSKKKKKEAATVADEPSSSPGKDAADSSDGVNVKWGKFGVVVTALSLFFWVL